MLDLKSRSESLHRTREAAQIFRLARWIGVSGGLERSFKITSGDVDARRFLISLALRPDFRPALQEGLRSLCFPVSLFNPLEQLCKTARFLHLGYEEPHGEPVCKIYCEAPPADGPRVKVHASFKWRPRDPDDFASDEYWRLSGLDQDGLRRRITETLEPNGALLAALQPLVDRVLARIPADEVFFLEVMRGDVRRSFDLRLYDAELVVADVASVALSVGDALAGDGLGPLLAECGEEKLGHVSAGPSFVTFYHGAEDLL
ncbi:MAG TPA: hypothetical protein VHV26_17085 [Rhizomicrobium sp.]|jgi:hypothetical protein|nr:hypothetical protein [Rhizomicrobium sp.]